MSSHAQGREVVDLNKDWKFKKGEKDYGRNIGFVSRDWEQVDVPHSYNKEDMQLGRDFYTGDAFYQKELHVKKEWKDKRLFLRFEGVGSVASLYVNGRFIGEHKGSYSAFAFEITHSVDYGKENTILVKVNNEARKDVLPINHFLFPIYGGIYRPVSLILTNKLNISVTDYASPGIYISQKNVSRKKADITVRAKLENKEKQARKVTLRTVIKNADGKQVAREEKEITVSPQGTTVAAQELRLKSPHLWQGVEDPYLYTLTTSVSENGKETDAVTQPLGIRRFELKAGEGMYLNGKKYPMYGVTRHQDRWKYGNALSGKQEEEDMQFIREIGATTIRLAHYQQSDHIYSLADKMGFLIWAEIPFVNNFSGEEAANAKQQMAELVRQNFNHPSIYIWGMHNEVYSKNQDEYVAVLTRELNDIAKTNDPDRLTGAVSGYGEMDRPANLGGDVQGINRYYGWYEGKIGDLEGWASGLEEEYPGHKVILAEYGADGNIDQSAEELPENRNPVSGKFFPENYQTETHIQQWAIIEKHPYIVASYLWNMFEFSVPMWNRGGVNARNLKGLITFDRKRKKDAFYWYKANWNPEPMLYLANRRDNKRTKPDTTVQVFTNLADISLTVNGKEVPGQPGVNDKHRVFEVQLQKGVNKVKATGKSRGETLADEMEWILK
ncbi:beta galactosidase jelly roll domain-containing protein [Sinomicrobium sp. FJxs]|uniref:Beta galactosidase jelly roll domain-containing protein n=2 Tax=Sinomicrobium weinanense TaxID=2842200 RepID=A0A926JS73_9FLAO|nr:beta galactosidase jelly roll domain-containing protein [Sinomicrobium weinanense]MBU3123066.1 beta galactosidase jelly roll domain-containing protein [Sinomicrobium weinanense]